MGLGLGAAATVALLPFGVEAAGQPIELGGHKKGLAPLKYDDKGALTLGQIIPVRKYMAAAMAVHASESVHTRDRYLRPGLVTAQTDPHTLGTLNEIVVGLQAQAARVEQITGQRTAWGGNATEDQRQNRVFVQTTGGVNLLFVHMPESGDITNLVGTLNEQVNSGIFADVQVFGNDVQLPVEQFLTEKHQLTDGRYALALITPHPDYTELASQGKVPSDIYLGINTHSFQGIHVR